VARLQSATREAHRSHLVHSSPGEKRPRTARRSVSSDAPLTALLSMAASVVHATA